jgi:hypothetical protein
MHFSPPLFRDSPPSLTPIQWRQTTTKSVAHFFYLARDISPTDLLVARPDRTTTNSPRARGRSPRTVSVAERNTAAANCGLHRDWCQPGQPPRGIRQRCDICRMSLVMISTAKPERVYPFTRLLSDHRPIARRHPRPGSRKRPFVHIHLRRFFRTASQLSRNCLGCARPSLDPP